MSPAGHWPQLRAAVAAGADAVYFGLQHFSARAKVGFSLGELPDAMRELHRSGVKGFVTFNTLVFDHELNQAEKAINAIAHSGADAIIVQDIGVAKLAKRIVPELEIHGSTQMSVTSAQGVELAASVGCSRVVLGRELDLKDIRRIAESTNVQLEVFVHGALCVSYSGQCFSSEAWGGRSANRGQCAQACRLSYDLLVDGQHKPLGEFRYLLSPEDLYAIEQVPELVDIGVACLKIEGRYKDSDYVTLTTQAYRQAIDQAVAGIREQRVVSKDQLQQVYSRGLGPHFLSGTNHQSVVRGRAPRHRGLLVGKVVAIGRSTVDVETLHEIHPGDGIVFDSAAWRSPDLPEQGGNVYEVNDTGQRRVSLAFGREDIDVSRIRAGDLVWRTSDPRLAKKIKQPSFDPRRVENGIRFHVQANVCQPLKITASTRGESAEFIDDRPLQSAENKALDEQMLSEQLGRLGKTPFHVEDVTLEADQPVFCPISTLNRARCALVDKLITIRECSPPRHVNRRGPQAPADPVIEPACQSHLHVLVRTPQQLSAAIAAQPASITLDYLELYGLRPSVEKIRKAGITARVASPRILKPSEQKITRFLLSLECQILVRSGGLLQDLTRRIVDSECPALFGDFSLNAANALSFETYIQMGLQRIAPSHDLNARQIMDLALAMDPTQLEVIAYHHLPVFHTEHCVFCRFLSDGTDNTNCGHPCEQHRIALKDARGRQHAVMADVGCRNTVFGAEVQSAAKFLDQMRRAGIRHFRCEFVHQDEKTTWAVCESFLEYFAETISSQQLHRKLSDFSPAGTTDGSLYVPDHFKQLVQLS